MRAKSESLLHGIILLGLFLITLFFPLGNYHKYGDENANLRNIELIKEHGLSSVFLEKYDGAAGPGYAMLQYLLLPVTSGNVRILRLVNLTFLLGLIILLSSFLQDSHLALLVMCIPMTYLCAPFAMTMMPCILFLFASFLLLKIAMSREKWIFYFISGVFLSFAIVTRLNVLLLVPLWILAPIIFKVNKRLSGILSLVFGIFPLIVWLVYHWHGLIPPSVRSEIGDELFLIESYSFSLVCITAAILAMAHCVVKPGWFVIVNSINKYLVGLTAIAVVIANYLSKVVFFLPAQVILSRFGISYELQYLLGNLCGSFMMIICIVYLFILVRKFQSTLAIEKLLSYLILSVLILSVGVASHAVSSRYAYLAIPFIFIVSKGEKDTKFDPYIRLASTVFGVTVYFYFRNYIPYEYIRF